MLLEHSGVGMVDICLLAMRAFFSAVRGFRRSVRHLSARCAPVSWLVLEPWSARRARLATASALALAAVIGVTIDANAQTAPPSAVPSMRVLRGVAMSPADAALHYGNEAVSTDGLCRDYSANVEICTGGVRPRAPEITELARALRHDADLIYEYVRNSIETEFVFGLHEGALAALTDSSGGPFDQAQLMVELLRASGISARYRYGDITLDGDQFYAWSGFRQARAGCEYLAAGGIPAVVNGSVGSCAISGDVQIVVLAHIWVEADLPGGTYVFDPSFKPHEHSGGIDIRAAMGMQTGAALAAATQGYTLSGDGRTVSDFNQPALANLMQSHSEALAARFRQSDLHGADMRDVLGGEVILPLGERPSGGWRQTSLSYVTASRVTWSNIPNQFRTVVEIRRRNSSTNAVAVRASFYLDEIAGRRLEIEHQRNPSSPFEGTGNPQIWLDGVPILTDQPYDPGYFLRLIIAINHPFAGTGGTYGDDVYERKVRAANPIAILYGQGATSANWASRWGEEQAVDREGVQYGAFIQNPDTGNETYVYSFGDRLRALFGVEWLAQFTMAADLHGRLASSRPSQLHTIGLASAWHDMGFTTAPGGAWFVLGPVELLDLQTAITLTSRSSNAGERRSALLAIAASAAALEGSVIEQSTSSPDTASTARRAAWGDEPEEVDTHMPGVSRPFRTFGATDQLPTASEILFDGSVAGPIPGYANWINAFKTNVISTISSYQQQGFSTVASMDAALGPGNLHGGHGDALNTGERGGLIVGVRYDAAGDPIEIAHLVLTPFDQAKGGGGFGVQQPPEPAGVLRSRFVDRSQALGVSLENGSVGYTSPVVRSVGHGEFPYRLEERLVIASGPSGNADPVANGTAFGAPRGLKPWMPATGEIVSSLFNAVTFSHSGQEAMGRSRIEGALATLVAFAAMQDIYATAPSPGREISGLLAANWWADRLVLNVANVREGATASLFVRAGNGDYHAASGDGSRILGNFSPARQGRGQNPYPDPPEIPLITTPSAYAISPRFWSMNLGGGDISLTRVDRSGAVTEYGLIAPHPYQAPAYSFLATRQVFADGVVLTYNYSSETDVRDLLSVNSNLGYTLTTSTAPQAYHFNPEDQTTYATACLSWTNNMASPPATILRSFTDLTGAQHRVRLRAPQRRTPTRRPMDSCRVDAVYVPSDLTTPSTLYTYDNLHRVSEARDAIAVRQPSGRGPHLFFIANGYRGERQDPLGGRYAVETLSGGEVRRHIDELNRVTTLESDGPGHTARVTLPEGDAIEQRFDLRGNVIEVRRVPKPGSGQTPIVISASYGEAASVLVCSNPRTCNRPLSYTDGRDGVTNLSWDSATGALTQVLQPADSSGLRPQTDYGYSLFGPAGNQFQLLTSITQRIDASMSIVTTQSYNAGNRFTPQTLTVDPGGLNLATTFTYDAIGNLTAEDGSRTDVSDVRHFTWDAGRRPVFEISADPDGAGVLPRVATRTNYGPDGRVISLERGTSTSTTGAGFASLEATSFSYDAAGNRIRIAGPAGVTQASYDALNRPICAAVRMNPAVYASLPSDACALSTAGSNGADRITRRIYDPAGQLLVEQRAYGTPLQQDYATYAHTDNGQRDWVEDANGNRSDFAYDGFDRLIRLNFPSATTGAHSANPADYEEYTYDENNNRLTLRLRSGGQAIQFSYDALNRETLKDMPGGSAGDVYSAHDLLGRRLFARYGAGGAVSSDCTASSNGVDYCYDRLGRLLTETSYGRRMRYLYEDRVNRTRITWLDNFFVQYTYDAMNRMDQARENGATAGVGVLADYSYDVLGRRSGLGRGNGAATTMGYDTASRLSALTQDMSGTAQDLTLGFTYNPASQILSRAVSNMAYLSPPPTVSATYVPNGLNQYQSVDGTPFEHDLRGNLVNDGTRRFCYDLENRLVGVSPTSNDPCSSPSTLFLGYDPFGRLRETSAGVTNTQFLYDGDRLAAEYDGAGTLLRRYVHGAGGDEPLVWYEGSGTGDRRWLHADHQGSIIATTNASAAADPYAYGAYGEPANDNWLGSRFRYTGQIALPEARLYHYKARIYDPGLGRFLQTDPVGYDDDFNLYAYVRNDPTNNGDPSGMTCAPSAGADNCDPTPPEVDCTVVICVTTARNAVATPVVIAAAVALIAATYYAVQNFFDRVFNDSNEPPPPAAPNQSNSQNTTTATPPPDPDDTEHNRDHIFGNPQHNLGGVVREQGGESQALRAIKSAASGPARSSAGPSGHFRVDVRVGSYNVRAIGRIVNNEVRLGTAYRIP